MVFGFFALVALAGTMPVQAEDHEVDLRGEIAELKNLNAQIAERLEQLETRLSSKEMPERRMERQFGTWADVLRFWIRPMPRERDAIPWEKRIFTPEEMRQLLDEWERSWFSDEGEERPFRSHHGVI
jgi:hypothetical protein